MDIKCAALVLVLLTVTVDFSETLPLLCANCLKISPEGIMTEKIADIQKRQKKSLKDADINLDEYLASGLADLINSRRKRVPQEGKMTAKNTRLHSEVGKREQRSVEDADMNLDEYFPLGLADKLHSRYRRIPPPGI